MNIHRYPETMDQSRTIHKWKTRAEKAETLLNICLRNMEHHGMSMAAKHIRDQINEQT